MVARVPLFALLFCCASALAAGNAAPSTPEPAGDELKNIQHMLEQQSEQIDVLAQEVARLNLLLEGRNAGDLPPVQPAQSTQPASSLAVPVPPAASAITVKEAAAPAPGAPGGLTHEVLKGETLTSIAKHYKVTVGELLKVNKIADVKRLQIGQIVNLPPDAKPPEDAASPAAATPSPTKP